MASKGQPLGIGLAIDFSSLDAQLSQVADKIEKVGKEATINVGSLSGLKGAGMDGDKMAEQMVQVGMSLSRGMASGIRTSDAILLGFASRINAVLDRMSQTIVEMFNRIDVAMKGHRWTNMLTGLSNALGNFASGSGKALSPLEKAMGGAFGGIAKRASAVFNTMFENLGKTITVAMDKAAVSMAGSMEKAAKQIETSMKVSLDAISVTVIGLSRTLSTSMLTAIEQIAAKFKDLKSSAEGVTGAGPGRPYVRQPGAIKEMKPIIDVDTKIKPPSQAELNKLAKSIGQMPLDLQPALFEKSKTAPPKMDFAGKMPQPQMFKVFKDVVSDVLSTVQKIPSKLGMITTAFNEAVASGNKAAIVVAGVGMAFEKVYEATAFVVKGTARLVAGFAAMGLAVAAAIGRSISFMQTLGSVGKHSFSELATGHNIFAAGILVSIKAVNVLIRGLWDLVTLRAFFRVGNDAKNAGSSIASTTGLVGKLTSSVARLGVELAAAFGVVGLVYKTVQFFQGGVKAAADLNAEVTRSKVVFGDSFGQVEEQVNKTTKAFKISKAAQLDVANAFGSMAQGAGVSEQKSADLAAELTSLAVDATGMGISFAEVSEAMKTGLSGRAISLKQFSVNIDESTTKAYAWAKGIASTGQELTNQQTLMAHAGMIMRGMSYAQGALTANAGQAAVQFQRAGGGIAVFAERMGELLLPAVQEGASGFDQLLSAVLAATEGSITTLQSWGATIKEVFGTLGVAVRNAGALWEVAQLHVNDFVTNTIAYILVLPENLQRIFQWIGRNWKELFVDMFNLTKAWITNAVINFKNLGKAIMEYLRGGDFKFEFTDLTKGFKAASEELPELIKPAIVSSQAEIDKIYARIGEEEQKLKDNAAKPIPGMKQKPIGEADKSKQYQLGGALEAGSKEAVSAISRGASGRSTTTDAVKSGVAVQKDTLKAINQQTQVIKDQAKRQLIEVK